MTATTAAPPTYDDVEVVVPAPGPGAGNWAGAASAVLVDGVFWLTWRVRRPLSDGRGVSVVGAPHFLPFGFVERLIRHLNRALVMHNHAVDELGVVGRVAHFHAAHAIRGCRWHRGCHRPVIHSHCAVAGRCGSGSGLGRAACGK